jgi:hypothetical protein
VTDAMGEPLNFAGHMFYISEIGRVTPHHILLLLTFDF